MKICIINNLYPPYARGGAEQVVERTVTGLLDEGHEVVLITTINKTKQQHIQTKSPRFSGILTPLDGVRPNGGTHNAGQISPLQRDPHASGRSPSEWRNSQCGTNFKFFQTHQFKPRNLFYYTDAHKHSFVVRCVWHVIDMFHVGSARFVRQVLKEEKPDVVHTHNLMGVGFLIPRVIRSLGIHHIHTVHDVQLVEPSGIILKTKEKSWRYAGLPTKLYTCVMKRLMGSPDVVISPSKFLKSFYEERGFFPKSTFVVVRNPMTISDYGQTMSDYETSPSTRFLYLGQVEDHKGIVFLAQVFKQFFEIYRNVQLHIVGDGSAMAHVQHIAEGCAGIILHGRVGRDALPALFAHTDVTVVPSLCYENSPTVIFESFSFGVPVLASNIEGIAELIDQGENGWTFEAGDMQDVQEKMRWCVEHRRELKVMRNSIPKTVQLSGNYIESIMALYC